MAEQSGGRRVLKVIASRNGAIVWAGQISRDQATIGRSPISHVVLDDPLVSWVHARVTFGNSGIVFTDCSTNGSFRNGERVGTVSLGPGGVIAIPPFEVDLSLDTIREPITRAAAPSNEPAGGGHLASTVPESPAPPSEEVSQSVSLTASETLRLTSAPSRFEPRVLVITVVGRLDGYTYGELKDAIAKVIDEGHRLLIVDLSKCPYCDHAGLGVLVNAHVTLIGRKGGLRLVGLTQQLKDAFRLLRLDDVLLSTPDERSAASQLSTLLRR